MKISWTAEHVKRLGEIIADTRPLYLFMGDREEILDAEWFNSLDDAVAYARTLGVSSVNILLYVAYVKDTETVLT